MGTVKKVNWIDLARKTRHPVAITTWLIAPKRDEVNAAILGTFPRSVPEAIAI